MRIEERLAFPFSCSVPSRERRRSRNRTQRDSVNDRRRARSTQCDRPISDRWSRGTEHLERFAFPLRFHPQCPRSNTAGSENRAQRDFANEARYERNAQCRLREAARSPRRTERLERIADPTRLRIQCLRANAARSENRSQRDFRVPIDRDRAVERRARLAFRCRRRARCPRVIGFRRPVGAQCHFAMTGCSPRAVHRSIRIEKRNDSRDRTPRPVDVRYPRRGGAGRRHRCRGQMALDRP